MSEVERWTFCLNSLNKIKESGKGTVRFRESLTILNDKAETSGLDDETISLLIDVITVFKSASQCSQIIKCLVPKYRMPDKEVERLIIWWFSSLNDTSIMVSTLILQWLVGLWEAQLINQKTISVFYEVFFYTMLKRERLEQHVARLIYLLTKPHDVTRRQVSRLLALQKRHLKPKKYIIALLSLFKSYKPELVPEKIPSMNIESVWRPIPEVLRIRFEDARNRAEIQEQQRHAYQNNLNWNVTHGTKAKKGVEPLIPSVCYFHIGSSIYKDNDTKSIFDISNLEQLGKYQLSVELPCKATSLLANTAGYHLLTFADVDYQSRFCFNLHNSLRRAFILDDAKFSKTEKERLLDMTSEFSRYMQQGIPVVERFLGEYLSFNSAEHRAKILTLITYTTLESFGDFENNILLHLHTMFYESSLWDKCLIIRSLGMLLCNLVINHAFMDPNENKVSPFLGQNSSGDITNAIRQVTKIAKDLIVAGLNVHSFNSLLLSEALNFYEQACRLETKCNIKHWTLAPPAVIYGGFVSGSCDLLSRVCALLLGYRQMNDRFKNMRMRNLFVKETKNTYIYAQDIAKALWFNESFSSRGEGYYLNNLPDSVQNNLHGCNLDDMLSINNHFAILPYKYTLSTAGLKITTLNDVINVAVHYFPAISEFWEAFDD